MLLILAVGEKEGRKMLRPLLGFAVDSLRLHEFFISKSAQVAVNRELWEDK